MVRRQIGPHLRKRLESQDVAQDVLVELLRSRSGFDAPKCESVRQWIAGVVRHRIHNLVDSHSAQRRDLRRE